jgi:hypothetical protein
MNTVVFARRLALDDLTVVARPTPRAGPRELLLRAAYDFLADGGPSGKALAVSHAVRLAGWARATGVLVVHVRNVVTRPGSLLFAAGAPATAFVAALAPEPGDLVITKNLGAPSPGPTSTPSYAGGGSTP